MSRVIRFALSALLVITIAATLTAQSPIRYVYDELGRLVGVIDANGDAAVYQYDAVGNLLSITRKSATQVSIIDFTPNGGPIGQTVTIYGTGFSATPSSNTVTFNGTSASITSASTTALTVTVPSGATTGTIGVTSPNGSATSGSSFAVTTSATPTISSVTPGTGVSGTGVTIAGTNFEATSIRNRVTFNVTSAPISSATSTSIATSVPSSATSGKIEVTTPAGTAISADDFIVAPPPFTTSDVLVTDRVVPSTSGTNKAVTIGTANKIALILFDGQAGQRVSLKVSAGMVAGITVYNHNQTTLGATTSGPVEAFIDSMTLSVTATYTILVDPAGTNTGTLTLTVYDVPTDNSGSIVAGGSAETVTTITPGQNGRRTFTGAVSQRRSLKVNPGPVGTVSIFSPDRSLLASVAIGATTTFIDTQTLAMAGTYTVFVDYVGKNTGSVTLTLYDVPADVSGTITPGGSSVTFSTSTPGQNGAYTFSGTAAQRVSVYVSGVTIGNVNVGIKNPDGTTLTSSAFSILGGFIEPATLGSTGTYSVFVDPTGANTGNATLNLYTVAADVSGTLTINGSAVNVSTTSPGQNGALTFSGTSGQNVTVRITNSDFRTPSNAVSTVTVKLLRPDGSVMTSTTSSSATFNLTTQALTTTGTYTVVVDPTLANTGSLNVSVTDP